MQFFRVTVGEFPAVFRVGAQEWALACEQVKRTETDLLVLNELPFGRWLPSSDTFDQEDFDQSVADHDAAIDALADFGARNVIGSRLMMQDGKRVNAGFVWREGQGVENFYTKQHVPNSLGYWEQQWYVPGERKFPVIDVGGVKVGMLICTDVMFNEHARHYGRNGAQLIVVPRAMPPLMKDFFDTAMRMASVSSGCYVASSNRTGVNDLNEPFEGRGVIYNPACQGMAQTSGLSTVAFSDIDLHAVAFKQTFYPCDVPE
ncbi:carbon-nitrogen hydrolase family protein [uncultured Algimonas sp.]|uniref:carbon-nitrogen hydrolase family protein n=1 Tax=uncultured Algimonas sp. TaxID=1547920 RepID=UPI00261D3425|nr:carbon-nitrogen hydrolase family protein [uncultured Algimonas sp.]